jgi:multidrug efflux system outer membrane protein
VAEAEQNLAAACAQVGVAEANFFPVVKLTGAAGFQATDTRHILDWQNRIFSLGPSVTLPIFQGGQLKAGLRQAKARYEELEANYRNAVLGAYNDVETALTDLHSRADEAGAQQKALDAAHQYLDLTQTQYRNGLVTYLQVINAEQTSLQSELSAVQILNGQMVSTVLLIKALGGGWEATPPAPEPLLDLSPGNTVPVRTAENDGKG